MQYRQACRDSKMALFHMLTLHWIYGFRRDGKQTVLDEDEFEELELNEELRAGALKGLDELKATFLKTTNLRVDLEVCICF